MLTLLGSTGPPILVQSLPAMIPLSPLLMKAMCTLLDLDLLPIDTLYVVEVLSPVNNRYGETSETRV